ncbi:MAG: HK97 family phage prohead protease [Planctomycetes bacterium]|nr:HK97 family phage prohead protease [Planctomycetota bacterium]
METESRIETADAGGGKIGPAGRSLSRWYEREMNRIAGELAELPDNAEAPKDLQERFLAMQRGRENSTLMRHLRESEKQYKRSGTIEQRVGLAVSSAPGLASGARATSTSTVTTAKSFVGYAAVFNKWADIFWFREQIAPGAFAEALKKSDVRCLFNHDANYIYGRSTANTLELAEDRLGLRFVCHLLPFDAASYGLARRIDRMDVSGCSFSFTVKKDTWKLAQRPGELDERTILEIGTLFDVGPVTYPAYPQTSVQAVFEKVPARSAAPAAIAEATLDEEEFYRETDAIDEQIERQDRSRARQRARDRCYTYHEMGRIIREVDRLRALQS